MEFLISDTFTQSLAKLTGDDQKVVKTAAFDLQINPANPGIQFHRLENVKDPNFWSVRVNRDIRLIVHRASASLLLCYVDHHDDAYRWAQRRKLETHPKTGAAQFVEVRETIQEITIPVYIGVEQEAPPKPPIFQDIPDDDLLRYGVPFEWLDDVRKANEDTVLDLADHLPSEAAEALLDLATGVTPQITQPVVAGSDPFEHPDAQRRFRVVSNVEELERALDFPWDKWTVFLHPAQRQLVEQQFNGPARVSGSAGTGKTIVALHRAVFLTRANPDARVLLTTFSETLANALRTRLRRLISNEPRLGERLEIHAMDVIGKRLYEATFGPADMASREVIREQLDLASNSVARHKFTKGFLLSEWEQVVDAWQLDTWESYKDVARLGRKTRLPQEQRTVLWSIFERLRESLSLLHLLTQPELLNKLAGEVSQRNQPPFDFVVVDEAQDISVAQLHFLAALGSDRSNNLFFAGDLGQRIFQQPFSWLAQGVDVRGRSRTLRINYRTSHQIRMQVDRLLGPELSDVDGNTEERKGTISVFNGAQPTIITSNSSEDEADATSEWIVARKNEGVVPEEFGIFVRSETELVRARAAVEKAGLPYRVIDENVEPTYGHVSLGTMHIAKGLEFRAVVVMACDDEVIPLQERIENVTDDADLEEVYNTERHLLYVACTRARDYLLVTGVEPASEFIDDLNE